MKRINIISLSVIICLGGIVFFLVCIYTYKSKKTELEQKTNEAFINALNYELGDKNLEQIFKVSINGKALLSGDIPDSVCMGSESGVHWYRLDPQKHRMNITSDTNVRLLHSYAFEENSINADSLNNMWKKHLGDYNKFTKLALSISVVDETGKVKYTQVSQSEWCLASNLMFTIYIGYACEVEIKGYLNYSLWRMMYIEILFYLLLYPICVFIIYKVSMFVIEKVKLMWQKKIIEVSTVRVVKEVTNTPIRSYILRNNVIFYAEQRIIEVDGKGKKMPLQACSLLELFLNAKDYIVTDDEIMSQLWPDGSGHLKRVHKAIARLRAYLVSEYPILIERENVDAYQLIV